MCIKLQMNVWMSICLMYVNRDIGDRHGNVYRYCWQRITHQHLDISHWVQLIFICLTQIIDTKYLTLRSLSVFRFLVQGRQLKVTLFRVVFLELEKFSIKISWAVWFIFECFNKYNFYLFNEFDNSCNSFNKKESKMRMVLQY